MADTLSTLQGDRKYNLAGESAPKGVRLGGAVAGSDSFGMGLQIPVADWERSARPPVDAIRRLHSQRLGKKVFPLIVAMANEERSVWLMGSEPRRVTRWATPRTPGRARNGLSEHPGAIGVVDASDDAFVEAGHVPHDPIPGVHLQRDLDRVEVSGEGRVCEGHVKGDQAVFEPQPGC